MKAARQLTTAWLFALGFLAPGLPTSTRAADGWHSAGESAPAEDRSILRASATTRREAADRLPAVSRVPVTAPAPAGRRSTAAKVSATMPVNRHRSDPPPVEQTSYSPREGLDPVDDVFADVFGEEEAARMQQEQQQAPVYQQPAQSQQMQPQMRQAQRTAPRQIQGQRAARGYRTASQVMPTAYQGQSSPRTMPPSAFGPGGPVPNRQREVLPTPPPRQNYGPQPTPADGSGMEWIEGSSPGPYADGYIDDGGGMGGMGCSSCGGGCDDGCCGDCGSCFDSCGDCCQDCGPYACPSCDMCHDCYGGLLKYTTVFGGPQAFKGPVDLGKNGNFGFHAGANFAGPVWFAKNIGGQIGAQWVGSDFSGTGVPFNSSGMPIPSGYNPTSRNQFFLTAGLFHRALPCTPWQFGAAFDYLDDRYYTNMSWSKIRGEVSFVGSAGDEIGGWVSIGLKELTLASDQKFPPGVSFQVSDLYTAFYRKYFAGGSTGRVWGGATNGGDGIVGGDMRMPLSDWFAMEANMNYIIPKSNTAEGPYNRESWSVMCNIVFYPGLNARCMTWSPWRPLFGVADNSTFILRRNN